MNDAATARTQTQQRLEAEQVQAHEQAQKRLLVLGDNMQRLDEEQRLLQQQPQEPEKMSD